MSEQLDRLDAMLAKALEEVRRLQAAGDVEQAEALRRQVVEPLNRLRPRIVLGDIAEVAQELNRLSGILETAERELAADLDDFFLNQLRRGREAVEQAESGLGSRLRLGRATLSPDPAAASGTAAGPPPPTTRAAYEQSYREMTIPPGAGATADHSADLIVAADNARRYREVAQRSGVPWWVIGLLHAVECSFSFRRHLHNGDPLERPTRNQPAGRPPLWAGDMRWEESAVDALATLWGPPRAGDTTLGGLLSRIEAWNGLGYRQRGIHSPFLWAGSDRYREGLFVADGRFDPGAVMQRPGAAVILKRMEQRGLVSVSRSGRSVRPRMGAQLGDAALARIDTGPFRHADAELRFGRTIRHGMGGPDDSPDNRMAVQRVQEWCCHHGSHTSVDGDFGDATRQAVRRFQARMALPVDGEVDSATWALLTRPLRLALRSGPPQPTLNQAVLAVAHTHIGLRPMEIGGNNRGPWVRLYMDGVDGEEQLWCAGFVCFLVAQAARDMGVEMPFARQVSVDALVRDARDSGRFIAEAELQPPALRPSRVTPGSLFVVRNRNDDRDWTHVGIVTAAREQEFNTIEGNTNGRDRDGANARASLRSYPFRDFLRLL